MVSFTPIVCARLGGGILDQCSTFNEEKGNEERKKDGKKKNCCRTDSLLLENSASLPSFLWPLMTKLHPRSPLAWRNTGFACDRIKLKREFAERGIRKES